MASFGLRFAPALANPPPPIRKASVAGPLGEVPRHSASERADVSGVIGCRSCLTRPRPPAPLFPSEGAGASDVVPHAKARATAWARECAFSHQEDTCSVSSSLHLLRLPR
jgi:hypothetical protein